MSDRKPKPRPKKPTRKAKPVPRKRPAKKAATVAETPPAPPASAPPAARPTNGLAVASLVCAVAGFTFVPVLGGFAAVGLGTAALRRHARDPERYEGKGLAIAGMCIGLVTGVLPVAFLALLASDDITPIPFVLVALYGGYAVWTALRGTTRRQKALAIGGGIATTIVIAVVAVGMALLLWLALTALFTEALSSIGDAFTEVFDGLGDALSGCSTALD